MDTNTAVSNAPQRSLEWYEIRKGKFSSSEIHRLMTDPTAAEAKKGEVLSKGAKTYVKQKIAEVYGYVPDEFTSEAMVWGVEQEHKAKHWYSVLTGNKVEDENFIAYCEYYGGSPDGKVITPEGVIGALEIKCPFDSTKHIDHCLIDTQEKFKSGFPKYYWQCVSHMLILDAAFCDFVSFDERIDKEIGLFKFRLERNQEEENLMLDKIRQAQKYRIELLVKLGLF